MNLNKAIVDLSQLTLDQQIYFLDSCYSSLSKLMENNTNNNKLAIISDTHGDFAAMLASLLESGIVKIKPGEFTYYDTIDQKFLPSKSIEYNSEVDESRVCSFFISLFDKKMTLLNEIVTNLYNEKLINFFDFKKSYKNIDEILDILKQHKIIIPLIEEIKNNFYRRFAKIIENDVHGELSFKIGDFSKQYGMYIFSSEGMLKFNKFLKENYLLFTENELEIFTNILNSNLCVIPTPFINKEYTGSFYHLGDIVDRGRESLTSLLFLEKLCDAYQSEFPDKKLPINIVAGNHEANDTGKGSNSIRERNGAEAYNLYKTTLARMLAKGYIKSGYILGNDDNNITLMTHSAFLESDLPILFYSFYNLCKIKKEDDLQSKENKVDFDSVNLCLKKKYLESLKREFSDSKLNVLLTKLYSFIENEKNILNNLCKKTKYLFDEEYEKIFIDNIKKTFSIKELLQIRTIMLDAMIKMNIEPDGKIAKDDEIYSSIESTNGLDDSLLMKFDIENITIPIGFWQRILTAKFDEDTVVCNQCLGHEPMPFITKSFSFKNNGKLKTVNFFDSARSYKRSNYFSADCFYAKDKVIDITFNNYSIPITTYYTLKNDNIQLEEPCSQTSYLIQGIEMYSINNFQKINSIFYSYNHEGKPCKKLYYDGCLIDNNQIITNNSSSKDTKDNNDEKNDNKKYEYSKKEELHSTLHFDNNLVEFEEDIKCEDGDEYCIENFSEEVEEKDKDGHFLEKTNQEEVKNNLLLKIKNNSMQTIIK